jgi:hypothetical protein
MSSAYDAGAARIVLSRFGRTQSTIGKVVQFYTGDIVCDRDPEPDYFPKGTFVVGGGGV